MRWSKRPVSSLSPPRQLGRSSPVSPWRKFCDPSASSGGASAPHPRRARRRCWPPWASPSDPARTSPLRPPTPATRSATGSLFDRQRAGHRTLHLDRHEARRLRHRQRVGITNTGSLAGDFKLTTANATGGTTLLNQLDAVVTDCGAYTTTLPNCTTGAMHGVQRQAGQPLQPGARQLRRRREALLQDRRDAPTRTNDTFQGQTATVDFAWSATQS